MMKNGMDNQVEYIAALIELHRGLDRQGPGDPDFSRQILDSLPPLPLKPCIADLGCGNGAGALLLAQYYGCNIIAVDLASVFIEELAVRAQQAGLEHLITPIEGDMAQLDLPLASLDLLWSEGAAYNLGFEQALKLWRPLLRDGGIAVISEISWFNLEAPEEVISYWQKAYPQMGSEAENLKRVIRSGFSVLSSLRLPSRAWWVNYYDPLRERIKQMKMTPMIELVIRETEEEMELFEKFSDFYGYTFYVLQAQPNP